jgi:hypothetical protein
MKVFFVNEVAEQTKNLKRANFFVHISFTARKFQSAPAVELKYPQKWKVQSKA